MHTQIIIEIDAKSEQEAIETLTDILLKVKTNLFPWPHDNNSGTWIYTWSNFDKKEDNYIEE